MGLCGGGPDIGWAKPMPSVSTPQHNLMEAAAHDPGFAAKSGVPQDVAKDFVAADEKAERHEGAKSLKEGGGVSMHQSLPHGYGR